MTPFRRALRPLFAVALAAASLSAWSDEAVIRKAWAERYPNNKQIDEIVKTPIPGLYELHVGGDILFSDEKGDYVIHAAADESDGHIVDTRTKTDLTAEHINKLTGFDFAKLPVQDAIVFRQGSGARRLVVFEDPNCPYCKEVEKNLSALKDVTIYTFVIPILGPDSTVKSRDIWCSKDNAHAWRAWMINGTQPLREMGRCDVAALDRNLTMATHLRVNGTPAIVFEDGSRIPGLAAPDKLEKRLEEAAATVAAKKG